MADRDPMADPADVRRARLSVQQALTGLESHRQRLSGCGNEPLRALLQRIEQGRAGHVSRLADWLRQHGPAALELDPGVAGTAGPQPRHGAESPDSAGAGVAPPQGVAPKAGFPVPLSERRQVTAELLALKVPRPPGFSFLPGQAARLELEGVRRDYSIVSAPHEPFLEFFVELVPAGQMSQRLRKLGQGGLLTLAPRARGRLTLQERFSNHFMVATVTGVNPFVSMLRDHLHAGRGGHRFFLLHGASYQDEFGYRDELEDMAAAHPQLLTYIPTVSRPEEARNAGWGGERGRVDTLLEASLERFGLTPESTAVYACGNPGMVDEVEARLSPRGFMIKTERYS